MQRTIFYLLRKMKVVILAGGLGTRISEESHLKPKPMITIGEQPILWHIMKYYSHYGFNDFVICCGYKGHAIKEYFADYYLHRSDVTFDFSQENKMIVHQNIAEPWRVTLVDTGLYAQTGARIKKVQKYIGDEPFMLTYGDGVSDVDLKALLDKHQSTGAVTTLTAIQPGSKFGVLELNESEEKIVGFREKHGADGGWINGGFMVMEPEIFNYIQENDDCILERIPLETLAKEGKLGIHKHYGYWQCMDTQRDRYFLETHWNNGTAPWKVW